MKMRKVGHVLFVVTALLWLFSLNVSCGSAHEKQSSLQGEKSHDARPAFYPYALPNFDTGEVFIPMGNHGSSYRASADGSTLRVMESSYDGPYEITLDLATGTVRGNAVHYPFDKVAEVAAPEKGGNLIQYLGKVRYMEPLLRRVGTPESQQFIASVIRHVEDLNIESVTAYGFGTVTLGKQQAIYTSYKAATDRDLLVAFCSPIKCYLENRLPTQPGFGSQSVMMDLPKNLEIPAQEMNDTFFAVKVVPRGAVGAQKLSEDTVKLRTQPAAVIKNIYNDVWGGHLLVRGQKANLRLTLEIDEPVKVMIRLVDKDNNVLAEQTYDIDNKTLSNFWHETHVNFDVPATITLKTEVHFTGRIIDKTGHWNGYDFGGADESGRFPFNHVISDVQ